MEISVIARITEWGNAGHPAHWSSLLLLDSPPRKQMGTVLGRIIVAPNTSGTEEGQLTTYFRQVKQLLARKRIDSKV